MNLTQGSKSLISDFLVKAYNGEVMLPDFQRNFVWTRQDIEELLKSLLENMFIGTFLIQHIDPNNPPFQVIPIEGTKEVNKNFQEKPYTLILDGQQRISSLFYAMYEPPIPLKNAVNPYRFFIDIEALLEDNIDEAVFSWSIVWRDYKRLIDENGKYNIKNLLEEKIIPVSFLKSDFSKIWYKQLGEFNLSDKESEKVYQYLTNILNYQVLTLEVSLNEKPENIAILFEKINRTGVKLSIFDLLVARLYKFLNLRTKWEKSFDNFENIRKIALNDKRDTTIPYYVVQSITLFYGMSIKARGMLKISEKELNEENWDRFIEIFDKFLGRFLDKNEYGIGDVKKWLPYKPMIIVMLALEALQRIKNVNISYEKINYWYWSCVFSERFSGSTETKIMKDWRELQEWFKDDNKVPEAVKEMRDVFGNAFKIVDKTNPGNAVYKGVFNELDDHHIFPRKFLLSKGVEVSYDTVANRTLIFSKTNKEISSKAPSAYLEEMKNKHRSEEKVKEILRDHFIDEEMYKILLNTSDNSSPEEVKENFEAFVRKREQLIKQEIAKLIGFSL